MRHRFNRFRALLKPKAWLEPKTLLALVVGFIFSQLVSFGHKWIELKMEEGFKTVGISVEYGGIETLAVSNLSEYVKRVDCPMFQMNLDDNILTNYFVIPLTFRNFTHVPVSPVNFRLDAGCCDAKILDVEFRVRSPVAKMISLRHDLPHLNWTLPTNSLPIILNWVCQPDAEVNVYASIAKDRGYGQVTALPLAGDQLQLSIAANRKPNQYFLRTVEVNGWGEGPPSTLGFPNPAYNSRVTFEKSDSLVPRSTLNAGTNMPFLEGKTMISFETGLDPAASVDVYVLGKAPSGNTIKPSLKMDGEPGVLFKEENQAPRLDMPYTETLDRTKLLLTPLQVRAVCASGKVLFSWDPTACSNYGGMRIFRSRERILGDYSDVGEEVFDEFGITNTIELNQRFGNHSPRDPSTVVTNSQRFFDDPPRTKPVETKPVIVNGRQVFPPLAPVNLSISSIQRLTGQATFIDSPPETNVVFTYTFYAFDHAGNVSYPVVVNAALDVTAANATFKILQ